MKEDQLKNRGGDPNSLDLQGDVFPWVKFLTLKQLKMLLAKDAKPKTSTPVKYYPGLGIAPKIAKAFDSNFKNQT